MNANIIKAETVNIGNTKVITDSSACVKEILEVLERHNVQFGWMDSVLDKVRDAAKFSTTIQAPKNN